VKVRALHQIVFCLQGIIWCVVMLQRVWLRAGVDAWQYETAACTLTLV
jgi:hypothetical protein